MRGPTACGQRYRSHQHGRREIRPARPPPLGRSTAAPPRAANPSAGRAKILSARETRQPYPSSCGIAFSLRVLRRVNNALICHPIPRHQLSAMAPSLRLVAAHELRTLAAELIAGGSGRSMKQSRAMSLVEAVANVVVGYGAAVITQILIFPVFGLHPALARNLKLGALHSQAGIQVRRHPETGDGGSDGCLVAAEPAGAFRGGTSGDALDAGAGQGRNDRHLVELGRAIRPRDDRLRHHQTRRHRHGAADSGGLRALQHSLQCALSGHCRCNVQYRFSGADGRAALES